MKLFKNILLAVWILSFAVACESYELDLLENPNAIAPENASLNDLYNNIQLSFEDVFAAAQLTSGRVARMYHAGGGTYEEFATPETFDQLWLNVYRDLLPDIEALENIAAESGFDIHSGTAKIMKAYTLLTLVDIFGDVPYSEALQGTDIISPSADASADVYANAVSLLDEAIATLDGTAAGAPSFEGFYGGDTESWIKVANTLKLKAALNSGDAATINSLISSGNIITSSADDFQFNFGNQRTNPNSRHDLYVNHYEVIDGHYLSNYYMWLLVGDKVNADGIAISDPRLPYYFYRKVEDAGNQDQTTYSCHFSVFPTQENTPAHWEATSPNVPYCILPGTGFSGRDHLNPDGIPPDGPIRTSYGLYPAGGQFDYGEFADTRQQGTSGGLGQGIWPILISSTVDLMRAEAALRLGTADDARAMLESGITASIEKAISFESLVPGTMATEVDSREGTGTVKELYGASEEDIQDYVASVLALYDAADDDGKLDLIAKEQMIASWGNGIEAYNLYRRTGKPNNMQPALEPAFGDFPRTFLYPANSVTRNANISQKTLNDRVFWDDGSVELY